MNGWDARGERGKSEEETMQGRRGEKMPVEGDDGSEEDANAKAEGGQC